MLKPQAILPNPNAAKFDYARSRRWLGITYVGTIVCLASLALFFNAPARFFGKIDDSGTVLLRNIMLLVLQFAIFTLPFDLSGFAIERHFKRTAQPIYSYLSGWLSSSFKHALLLVAFAISLTSAAHTAGIFGISITSLILALLLIWKQTEVARWYSGLSFEDPPQEIRAAFSHKPAGTVPLLIGRSNEAAFTGGIVGMVGSESIVIPRLWLTSLSQQELWAELTRRNAIIRSGGRMRGVMLAVLFTVGGIIISSLATSNCFQLHIDTTAGLLNTSCCFTLWSFLGLMIMPHFSQLGVMEADQLALTKGVSRELLLRTIGRIDRSLEDESSRARAVETIFHPIPTVLNRQGALDRSARSKGGAWHAARYAVMLSIVGLGLLGRAVHCNAGKPDLWALLPAD